MAYLRGGAQVLEGLRQGQGRGGGLSVRPRGGEVRDEEADRVARQHVLSCKTCGRVI